MSNKKETWEAKFWESKVIKLLQQEGLGPQMQELVHMAFGAGIASLEDGQPPLLVFYIKDGKKCVARPPGESSDEVFEKVRAGARDTPAMSKLVFLGMGDDPKMGKALLARCGERGAGWGFILAWELQDGDDGILRPVGEVSYGGQTEDLFA